MSLMSELTGVLDSIWATTRTALQDVRSSIGNLAALNTSEKGSVVGAINETKAALDAAAQSGGAAIDDANASTATVYSSAKTEAFVLQERAGLKAELLGGVEAAYDTFQEFKVWVDGLDQENDDALAAAIVTLGNKANSADVYTKTEIGDITTDLAQYWSDKGAL